MTATLPSMVGGNNVFRELGFAKEEAQAQLLRGVLVIQIRKGIDKRRITKA